MQTFGRLSVVEILVALNVKMLFDTEPTFLFLLCGGSNL